MATRKEYRIRIRYEIVRESDYSPVNLRPLYSEQEACQLCDALNEAHERVVELGSKNDPKTPEL